jgi:hypothetical protein
MGLNLTVGVVAWLVIKYCALFGVVSFREAVLLSGSAATIVVFAVWEQLDGSCSALGSSHLAAYILMATAIQFTNNTSTVGHITVAVMASRLLAESCIVRGVAAAAMDLGIGACV